MAIASMTGFAREAGVTGPYPMGLGDQDRERTRARGPRAHAARLRCRRRGGARRRSCKALTRGQGQLALSLTEGRRAPEGAGQPAMCSQSLRGRRSSAPAAATGEARLARRTSRRARRRRVRGRGRRRRPDAALHEALRGGVARADRVALKPRACPKGRALRPSSRQQLDAIARLGRRGRGVRPARQPDAIRARLAAQIAELLDGRPRLDPDRLHQEAMLIAARADIREELDRLRAHVESARGAAERRRRGRPPPRFPGAGIRARGEYPMRQGERRLAVADRPRTQGRDRAVPRAGSECGVGCGERMIRSRPSAGAA